MKELKIINQQEVLGKDFKVYGDFENPLFLAKDVAEWIEYNKTKYGYYDTSTMLRTIDEDEKLLRTIFRAGQNREMWFLTEDGLYEVLMQSRKPIAKQFKKEVKKILKDVRKHGMYAIDDLIENPDLAIKALTALKEERAKVAKLTSENKELERTKAWINDKKTATAMNTASQKSKEVRRLKIELDRSKEYASIKAVEKSTRGKFKWQPLRNYCTSHELEMKKVFDPNFGAVNTYPAEAWQEVYAIDLTILFD